MYRPLTRLCLLLSCLVLSVVGCGDDGLPERAIVRGRITTDGAPLQHIIVNFFPMAGGRSSRGMTDENGNYQLTTFDDGDGALIGEHNVTINGGQVMDAMTPKERVVWHFPPKYSERSNELIKRTVIAGEDNVFDFESKDL